MSNEYVDLASGEIIKDESKPSKSQNQNITINDATSEIGKILVHEFGSDIDFKETGKVDVRRFTNISSLDKYWLIYFLNLPDRKGGKYAREICEEYMNVCYGVGGEHKKTVISFQNSLNNNRGSNEPKDKRNFIQKHITHRGEPIYDE
ncbi:MAG: hypothetical protein GF317_12025 [Candidatus Lokiarchaeota archaeon]|nr:hypothetical protein [Candidatus Lokiarchaeota archaeon]